MPSLGFRKRFGYDVYIRWEGIEKEEIPDAFFTMKKGEKKCPVCV